MLLNEKYPFSDVWNNQVQVSYMRIENFSDFLKMEQLYTPILILGRENKNDLTEVFILQGRIQSPLSTLSQ